MQAQTVSQEVINTFFFSSYKSITLNPSTATPLPLTVWNLLLNFKFNSLNIKGKRFSHWSKNKKEMCLRKLCLLVLKPLIFYSDYLRQVVACGSKSVTGRDFNADMKSEIS